MRSSGIWVDGSLKLASSAEKHRAPPLTPSIADPPPRATSREILAARGCDPAPTSPRGFCWSEPVPISGLSVDSYPGLKRTIDSPVRLRPSSSSAPTPSGGAEETEPGMLPVARKTFFGSVRTALQPRGQTRRPILRIGASDCAPKLQARCSTSKPLCNHEVRRGFSEETFFQFVSIHATLLCEYR